MITVIIPTLWKIDRLNLTLKELELCDHVGEIILIDNTGINKKIENRKLIYILENENTYVNPSWNKGVKMSSNDKICILNDDIWFNWDHFKLISPFISDKIGMIGMSSDNYNNPEKEIKISKINPYWKSKKGFRPYGYGCCIFIHKNNWIEIPSEMKIWAGDDFIFYYNNNLENYIIEGMECKGYMSYTNDIYQNEFDEIRKNDMSIIKNYIKKNLVDNYLKGTIWE